MMRQIFAVTALGFRSLPRRFGSSLIIVISVAAVVGVLLSMMSMTVGLRNAWARAGDPGRAIILPAGIQGEGAGAIPRAAIDVIKDAPGIAKDADGTAIADPEILAGIPVPTRLSGLKGYILLRSFGPKALILRPEFKLASGRMFQPGKHELMVGIAAPGQFSGVEVGDKVILPDGEWPIVGAFKTGGDVVEAELVGDTDTVMASLRKPAYNSVIVRLANPDALATLKHALTINPALSVSVERHSAYYARRSEQFSDFYSTIAYSIAGILAAGALFGAVNILYSAVSARTRETGTLRALGFGSLPIAVSIGAEAILLCLTGAIIGASIAWSLYDGKQDLWGSNVFRMTVTPGLIGLGFVWALAIAILGAMFPAIQAARMSVVQALRPS